MVKPELPPIHVVPIDEPPDARPHTADRCWCGPIVSYRAMGTGRPVVRHRRPPVSLPRPKDVEPW